MHIFTNKRDNEWLPIMGIRFHGMSDLVFAFLVFVMALVVIALLLLSGMRILRYSMNVIIKLAAGIIVHAGVAVIEISLSAYNVINAIPFSWYGLTGFTIIPMVLDIPRPGMVWFLIAYCIPNAWIAIYCITKPEPIKAKQDSPPIQPPNTTTTTKTQLQSQLFTGMRISIG
jgi:hypothetical protein